MTDPERHEMVLYRLNRAKETINEVSLHIENRLWATAINRMYYACFYAVSALLLKENIKAQTHGGTRQMFGLHFIKSEKIPLDLGKFYSDIFDMRHTGDYDDFVDFSEEEVLVVYTPAKELIARIEKLIK